MTDPALLSQMKDVAERQAMSRLISACNQIRQFLTPSKEDGNLLVTPVLGPGRGEHVECPCPYSAGSLTRSRPSQDRRRSSGVCAKTPQAENDT